MNPNPKLYHIVHLDRLSSILQDEHLFSDRLISEREDSLVSIGMEHIKSRRLNKSRLTSHPELFVGDCVPFYFCPRSVMLYVINSRTSVDINYRDGQAPIVHLVSDFSTVTTWAEENNLRWAFTSSNAGSNYFEDFSNADHLSSLNWKAINAKFWAGELKEGKQAEFLLEKKLPFSLIEEIGVYSAIQKQQVEKLLKSIGNTFANVSIKKDWYY